MCVRSEIVMLTFGGARKVEVRDGTRLTNLNTVQYEADAYCITGRGDRTYPSGGQPPHFVNLTKVFHRPFKSCQGSRTLAACTKPYPRGPF